MMACWYVVELVIFCMWMYSYRNHLLMCRDYGCVKLLLEISECVHCVPMAITPLFIRFEHMSNNWKVEEVNYEFGIGSFLRLYLD
jgi:hypothetical protein